jgi:hypothetical protein
VLRNLISSWRRPPRPTYAKILRKNRMTGGLQQRDVRRERPHLLVGLPLTFGILDTAMTPTISRAR